MKHKTETPGTGKLSETLDIFMISKMRSAQFPVVNIQFRPRVWNDLPLVLESERLSNTWSWVNAWSRLLNYDQSARLISQSLSQFHNRCIRLV